MEKIYRIYPFFYNFVFLTVIFGIMQAIGMHINLKSEFLEYSTLVRSLFETVFYGSINTSNLMYFEFHLFIYSFTRMLTYCFFIAISIYLFAKSSRINDKVIREPIDKIDEKEI